MLAVPAFRRLWLAQVSSRLGEAIALVAMPLLVYDLTGSAELLGLIFVLQLLPRVILAPIAGLLADRLDRRRILLGTDLARAALVALLPFADQAWQVAVVAMLVAVGNAIAQPAELAAVPAVVPAEQLVSALSITQLSSSIVRVIGPTIAAGVISVVGPGPAFGLQTVCFLISAVWIAGLTLPPVARTEVTTGIADVVRQEIGEGLRIVRDNPIVRGITAVEALWQTVVAILVVTLVVYTEETLHLGNDAARIYSLSVATLAAGTAAGALVARPVEHRIGRPWLMAIGYLAPLTLILAGLVPLLPVVFACIAVLGFTDAWAVISMQTYLAEAVPDALRGRVYASWLGAVTLAQAIAFGVIGWVTARLGAPPTFALAGALVGIGGPILLLLTGCVAAIRHEAKHAT